MAVWNHFRHPQCKFGDSLSDFFGHHADYPFFSSDFADERAGIGFFRQPACAEILDFGVGFCRDCLRLACQYHFAGFCLHCRPSADRCTVDISAAPRPASRFPCEMVVRAASRRPALRPAAGIRQLGLLGPDFDWPLRPQKHLRFGRVGHLLDGGQLWRRRPDFPKRVFHYLGAFGVQMGRRKNQFR